MNFPNAISISLSLSNCSFRWIKKACLGESGGRWIMQDFDTPFIQFFCTIILTTSSLALSELFYWSATRIWLAACHGQPPTGDRRTLCSVSSCGRKCSEAFRLLLSEQPSSSFAGKDQISACLLRDHLWHGNEATFSSYHRGLTLKLNRGSFCFRTNSVEQASIHKTCPMNVAPSCRVFLPCLFNENGYASFHWITQLRCHHFTFSQTFGSKTASKSWPSNTDEWSPYSLFSRLSSPERKTVNHLRTLCWEADPLANEALMFSYPSYAVRFNVNS